MAVIAGIWQRGGGRVRADAIADMLAALHSPFHGVLSAFDDDKVACCAKSLARPAIVSQGGIVAALSGRLDDGCDVADVIDAYNDADDGALQRLTGDYAIVVYDPHRQTIMLMRDAIGTQPLYYAISADAFVFGSQIKAVIAGSGIPARPNHAALAQLLVSGEGTSHGETCYAGVHSLPPGFTLFVTTDGVSNSGHVDLRPIVPTPLKTFEQSAAAFRRALIDSVERRIARDGNTAILVSGGLSSAAIVCAAASTADRDRIVAISYGLSDGSPADERKYVNAVVSQAGVRSVYIDLKPIGFPDQIEADVLASESPLIGDAPGTLRRAGAAARAHGAHHLLMGNWGDQVLFPFPPPYLLELLHSGKINQYRTLARSLGEWMIDVPHAQLRRSLFGQAMRGILPTSVRSRLKPLRRTGSHTFDMLERIAKPRRHIATTHAAAVRREVTGTASVDALERTTKWGWGQGVETQLPFVDADLVQLLFAIPAAHALHDGVPKALLRAGMRGNVPDLVLDRRDRGDHAHVIRGSFNEVREECLERLEHGTRLVRHGLMSPDAAARSLARLRAAGEIDTSLLVSVVGIDAWLKLYFEDKAGRPQ